MSIIYISIFYFYSSNLFNKCWCHKIKIKINLFIFRKQKIFNKISALMTLKKIKNN